MANTISFDSKKSKNTQSVIAKQETKSSVEQNSGKQIETSLVEMQSRPTTKREYDIIQPGGVARNAYEEYLTTGQIDPKYASRISFEELEAFGAEHTHKLSDGRYFYAYEDSAIMDGYRFDRDAIEQAKSLFDDYWEKTGSQSAKWGYDLTNPEDYQRYMDGRPSLKYEAGYGEDAYSLWLKENGLGHADFFTNDSGTGYYDKALFDVAETRKQEQETADFMKAVKSRARYLAADPTAITMDEIYAAALDVRSANPEWRHFDLENPGTAKKTIEDFQDSASPDLAYQEYLDGLDKKRGEYGYVYMDELYASVTGKPYTGAIDGTLASQSSSSSSASSAKTTAAEEQLYSAAAEWLARAGKKPTAENVDEAVSEVIASDTTGIFDDLKFVEEKDYSDSTWGSVSATRDKAKGITIAEATEGIQKAYEDWAATEITPPADYVPSPSKPSYTGDERNSLQQTPAGYGMPDDDYVPAKTEADERTYSSEPLRAAVEMIEEYRSSGEYSENAIRTLVEGKGLPYDEAVRYIGLWERERQKKVVDTYHQQAGEAARQDTKVSAELEKKKEQASSIIDEAIEETRATTHRTRVHEFSADVAVDRLMNDMGLSFEEATALMREDGRLDYRDSTYYKEVQKEQEERIQAIADSSSVYQSYLAKEKELRQGNNQDIEPLDSVAAATEAYAKLKPLGFSDEEIAEQMALHGLRIEDVEGYEKASVEGLDALIDSAVAAEEKAEETPVATTTFSGVGPSTEVPIWKDTIEAVDSVILSLVEDQGYSVEQALSVIDTNGRLRLSDSERYKEEVQKYYQDKRVFTSDYSAVAEPIIVESIYNHTVKTEPIEKKREELDMFHGAAAEELYPKVLEAVGGDEALAVYYMGTLGLDATKVAQFVREERAAAEAEAARVQKEADEDALMAEVFGVSDMEYYVDPETFVISPETASPELTARVVEYRAQMKERGASDFDVDNALRRNGLGDMVSTEDSGAHFFEDVLVKSGFSAQDAQAIADSLSAEQKEAYGKEAPFSANWEDSSEDVFWNTASAIVVNGTLSLVSGFVGFADMVTGHQFESVEDAIDSLQELQGRMQALAEDPNHKYSGMVAEVGAEVLRLAGMTLLTKGFGKAAESVGAIGKSAIVQQGIANGLFVSSAMGSYFTEAMEGGATVKDATTYAFFAGAIEGITERSVVSGKLIPKISSGIGDQIFQSNMKTSLKSFMAKFGLSGIEMLCNAVGEGYEEGLSYLASTMFRQFTWDDHYRMDFSELKDNAAMGAIIGLVLGAFSAPANSQRNQMVMSIYEAFKENPESASVPIDDLAAVTAVETEISPDVWKKYKEDYTAGRVVEVSDEEFSKAYATASGMATKNKQESRRYSEKVADYESQISNAQKAVDSVVHQLKSLQDGVDKRGDGKYTIEEAKSFKSLVDSLMVKERDLERATAAAETGRAAADEEYAGNAGKIKSDYADAVKTVREWFMQRALKMDLQLFGAKADAKTENPANNGTETPLTNSDLGDTIANGGDINGEQRDLHKSEGRMGVERLDSQDPASASGEGIRGTSETVYPIGASGTGGGLYATDSEGRRVNPQINKKLSKSSIRDESGALLMLYHYTPNMDFTEFLYGDTGFHFGNFAQAKKRAYDKSGERNGSQQGRYISVYLDIRKPVKVHMDIGNWNANATALRLWSLGYIDEGVKDTVESLAIKDGGKYNSESAKILREALMKNGYDGIEYENQYEGTGKSYIAFSPEQVVWIGQTDSDANGNLSEEILFDSDSTSAIGVKDSNYQPTVSPEAPLTPVADTAEPKASIPIGSDQVEGITNQDLMKSGNWFTNWARKMYGWMVSGQASLERISNQQKRDGSSESLSASIVAARNAGGTVNYILKNALVDKYGNDLGAGSFDSLIESIKDPESFIEYMSNLHNIDRMSIEDKAKPQLDAALKAVDDHLKQHPELAVVSIEEAAKMNSKGNAAMAEYSELARRVQEMRSLKNLPVLKGEDGKKAKTADESKTRVAEMEKASPELKQWARQYNEWMNAFGHAWLVDTGIISQETWDEWHTKYKNYFPTNRLKYADKTRGTSYANWDNAGILDPVKAATGATSELEDFRNIIAKQVNSYVRTVRKNDVLMNLYNWTEANPAAARTYAMIVDDPSTYAFSDVGIDLNDMEIDPDTLAFEAIQSGQHILRTKRNGEWAYMAVSKEVHDAVGDLFSRRYSEPAQAAMNVGKWLTGMKKGLITVYNPFFAVTNLMRDIQTAYISDESANPLSFFDSYRKAVLEMSRNSEDWKRFLASGVNGGGYFNSRMPYLEQMYGGGSKNSVGKLIDAIGKGTSWFGSQTEDMSRFAAYIRYLDKHGRSDANYIQAAQYAAEITTDFGRSGSMGKFADCFCVYLNANIQGLDKIGRQLVGSGSTWKSRGGVIGKSAGIALASSLLRGLLFDEEENEHYQNLPSYVKDAYFCIPNVFDKDENGTSKSFIKIPKAQGYNVIISAFERLASMWVDGNGIEEAYDGFMSSLWSALPVSPSIVGVSNYNALKNNKDWKGDAIEPSYMSDEAVTERYDNSTSAISIRLSKLINSMGPLKDVLGSAGLELSPMMIEYILDQNTGVIGDFLLPATAVENYDDFGTEEQKYNPGSALKSAADIIQRRFVVDPVYSNGLYAKYKEAKEVADDAASVAQRERELAKVSEKSDEEKLAEQYKSASKWLSESYKEERAILNSETNTKSRDKKLDKIREARNGFLKSFMEDPAGTKVQKYKSVLD